MYLDGLTNFGDFGPNIYIYFTLVQKKISQKHDF